MDYGLITESLEVLKLFFQSFSSLGDAHMVDYFVKDHWNELLDEKLRNELMCLSVKQLRVVPSLPWSSERSLKYSLFNDVFPTTLKEYDAISHILNLAKSCRLAFFKLITDISEVRKKLEAQCHKPPSASKRLNIKSKEYMCTKKSHEVSEMAPLVNCLSQFSQTNCILDVGSGKGYLSTYLTLCYDLNVTGIEANEENSNNALTRAKKYLNYWAKHLNNKDDGSKYLNQIEEIHKFKSVVTHITDDTELDMKDSKYIAVGLHACGDLCCNIISFFTSKPNIVGLCAVGCCYHLNTEAHECGSTCYKGFPMSSEFQKQNIKLGRTKRMLALQAPERNICNLQCDAYTNSERSLFYRAVLTVIMKEELSIDCEKKDCKVGKIFSKSKNFLDYVRKSFKKLNIDDTDLQDDVIVRYLHKYEKRLKELVAFVALRQVYAPVVEMLILFDRFMYLIEHISQSEIQECFLTEIFDPVLSPRRFALVAVKKPHRK